MYVDKSESSKRGSFGEVCKVTWRDKEAAMKIMMLPKESETGDSRDVIGREKFEKEANLAYSLSHPNIVKASNSQRLL